MAPACHLGTLVKEFQHAGFVHFVAHAQHVIAARNVVVKLAPSRPIPAGKIIGKGAGKSSPAFQLFDPPKRVKPVRAMKVRRLEPRIHFFDYDPRVAALFPAPRPVVEPPPPPDGLASATRLHRQGR